LAYLHNRHYSEFVENAAAGVIAMLRSAGITSGVVCDLGCGGGQLSARLLKAGYKPIGIDISAAMVRIARAQVTKARFIQGSISTLRLPEYAAAVAVGEVFNYLGSKDEMKRAFRNIFRSLLPGGVLVFDIKEPLPGNSKKTRTAFRRGRDWAIFVEVEEYPLRNKLTRRIVSFRKAGAHYRRTDEVHYQSIHRAVEIARLLRASGFHVRVVQAYGSMKLPRDRKVLVAKKPAQ
jgi:SAM-dependent methyltransferase